MVPGVYLFDLASMHGAWLGNRASVVSSNISHASTPGFKARDVEPFSALLEKSGSALAVTNVAHMGGDSLGSSHFVKAKTSETWDTYVSGNSVSVEQELLKAGEVNSSNQMNTSIIKSFHKMIIMSVKGG